MCVRKMSVTKSERVRRPKRARLKATIPLDYSLSKSKKKKKLLEESDDSRINSIVYSSTLSSLYHLYI